MTADLIIELTLAAGLIGAYAIALDWRVES